MRAHLKPALLVLWTFVVSTAPTELNLYISKDHLSVYYNISVDDKVLVVHKRENRVNPSHLLTFANGTGLPPFPGTVDEVTFTWLATEKEEVTYSIGLQEDLQQPSLLMNPTISISDTGLVPENRSTFDISLNCASMASGVARIGVNLSLHYHDDNFSLPVFFYLEKDCTAGMDLSDKVQPTETAGEDTKTLDLEGSGISSTNGGMEASLASLGLLPPTTTVGSRSSHGNMVTSMSSYAVTSTMKSSQSETTILLSTSIITKQLSSTPLPQSDAPFTSSLTVSTSSRGADITITSVIPSSVLSSLEDIHSSFTSVSSSSSVLQSTTSVPSSMISSAVKETPSSLLVESSGTISSTMAVDVLSSSTSTPETSSAGYPVTTAMPLSTSSTFSSTTTTTGTSLFSSVSHEHSSSAPVSSISVTSSPSVLSQGVNSTLPGSSLPISSFTPIFSSSLTTSSFIITLSSPIIVSTLSASTQSSQSDPSTSIEISSTVVPSVTTTKSSRVPVPSTAPNSSMMVETSSIPFTTSLSVSLTVSNASLTSSTTSVTVTSTSHVLSSSMTSTTVTMVTTSSSTKPTTSTVSSQPVPSSTKGTESLTTFITPSLSDLITSSRATSSVSQTDTTISDTSSSVSSKLISSSILSSTSKTATSARVSTSSRSVPPVKSTSRVHSPSILLSLTKSVSVTSATSVVVESSATVGAPTASSETDEASLTLIIIVAATTSALITVCVMLICIIMAMMCRRRRKPRRRRSPVDNAIRIEFNSPMHGDKYKEENIGPPSASTSLRWGSIRNLSKPAQKLVEQLAVDRESLEMLDTIKKGEYGWLVKATASTEPDNDTDTLPTHQLVLVKMITGLGLGTKACGSCEEVSEFLDQATLLRGISHHNILAVMGLCSDDHQAPIVIYSYPSIGNLHTFLTAHKQATSATIQKGPVTPKLLMDLCVQLAEAMKHLECFRIIHPDLQLRTCYLDEGYTLKLADGALMSDFYPECYHVVYGAQRPVRWSALETLQGGLCTLQSNVWSFGITIWEIITMGDFPYSEVTNRNVLAHVMLGSRLEQPHDCPNELYETMCNCWHTIPRQRPMFIQIASDLKHVARLYNINEEIGAPSSDSAFFKQQQQLSSSPQAFHYNDKDMSYLLSAPITEADGVSITFSALGSTEDLTQAGENCMEGDNKHEDVRSSVDITTETSSSICSPEEQLSPIPHINIAPPDIPYTNDQQQSVVPNRVPLRNEPPVNKFLLKANGSRESTPDYRYSMSSDSQYSSSQFSSDASDNSRQHLIRHKRDSPEKKTTAIAEHSHKEEKESSTDSNNQAIPSMEGGMLSELMVSFDQRLSNSSHQ